MPIDRFAGTSPVAGAPVSVFLDGTQAFATIYADELLTPQANPFFSDGVTGEYAFYADDAVAYDISLATEANPPLPPGPADPAPAEAEYIVGALYAGLDNARVLTAGSGIDVDLATAGQAIISATGAGTGDVVGPASAVDDRIATFNLTTGKLIQDGGQTIAEVITAAVAAAIASIIPVDLAAEVTGNLPVAHLAGGSGATSSTFWRGDGSWAAAGGGGGLSQATLAISNADILAGSTTPLTVVAAPGAGFAIIPVAWSFVLNTVAGAYGQNGSPTLRYAGDSRNLFDTAGSTFNVAQRTSRFTNLTAMFGPIDTGTIDNKAVVYTYDAAFITTGGNAANSAQVDFWYYTIAVP